MSKRSLARCRRFRGEGFAAQVVPWRQNVSRAARCARSALGRGCCSSTAPPRPRSAGRSRRRSSERVRPAHPLAARLRRQPAGRPAGLRGRRRGHPRAARHPLGPCGGVLVRGGRPAGRRSERAADVPVADADRAAAVPARRATTPDGAGALLGEEAPRAAGHAGSSCRSSPPSAASRRRPRCARPSRRRSTTTRSARRRSRRWWSPATTTPAGSAPATPWRRSSAPSAPHCPARATRPSAPTASTSASRSSSQPANRSG